MEYAIASSDFNEEDTDSIGQLKLSVECLLNKGFKPQGGVSAVSVLDEVLLTQAMIKHDE